MLLHVCQMTRGMRCAVVFRCRAATYLGSAQRCWPGWHIDHAAPFSACLSQARIQSSFQSPVPDAHVNNVNNAAAVASNTCTKSTGMNGKQSISHSCHHLTFLLTWLIHIVKKTYAKSAQTRARPLPGSQAYSSCADSKVRRTFVGQSYSITRIQAVPRAVLRWVPPQQQTGIGSKAFTGAFTTPPAFPGCPRPGLKRRCQAQEPVLSVCCPPTAQPRATLEDRPSGCRQSHGS